MWVQTKHAILLLLLFLFSLWCDCVLPYRYILLYSRRPSDAHRPKQWYRYKLPIILLLLLQWRPKSSLDGKIQLRRRLSKSTPVNNERLWTRDRLDTFAFIVFIIRLSDNSVKINIKGLTQIKSEITSISNRIDSQDIHDNIGKHIIQKININSIHKNNLFFFFISSICFKRRLF